jgi:AraC family transcriptional regulator of adaptative response / DNA-3-methyladenine glycosylase II
LSTSALASVEERLRRVLGLDTDTPAAVAHLAKDPLLVPRLAALPGLRIPGGWDGFELAIRAILGQQITVKAARLLAGRLAASFGDPLPRDPGASSMVDLTRTFPSPERLAALDPTALGMPRARAEALRALATAAASNPALFQRGPTLEDTIVRLRALRGIGDWTAHYIALRGLREPDAFPASDIGLLRGAAVLLGQRLSPAELLAHADRWRPFRAYAAQHLWALDAERGSSSSSPSSAPPAAARRTVTKPRKR